MLVFLSVILLVFAVSAWVVSNLLSLPPRSYPRCDPAQAGLDFEKVEFSSSDGLALRGWWIPMAESGKPPPSAILVHPFGGNRGGLPDAAWHPSWKKKCEIDFNPLAARLHQSGFNVLMFDLRGHGESAPGRCAGGLNEDQDISGAVHYTIERVMNEYHLHPARDERVLPEDLLQRTPRVGVIGYGLGAAAALAAVGRKKGGTEIYKVFNGDAEGGVGYIDILPDEIKRLRFLVLLEPASLAGVVKGFLHPIPLGIIRMFCGLVDWMRQAQGSYPMDGAQLNRFAGQVNVPTMFVRAESDDWGTRNEVERLYAAVPVQKRLDVIAGVGRMKLLDEHSDVIERILAFAREFSDLYLGLDPETSIHAGASCTSRSSCSSCSSRSSQTDPGPVLEGSSGGFSA